MKLLISMALGALALSGCTGTHIKPPAVCDGKHRRPANLYGSILPTLPIPLPPSQSIGQSMVAPPSPGVAPASGTPEPPPMLPLTPTPAPDANSSDSAKPAPTSTSSPSPAPRTSRRDVALSYLTC